jgi:hypothetical protein
MKDTEYHSPEKKVDSEVANKKTASLEVDL